MSKTNSLEIATTLATITGRPLEEFYNGTVGVINQNSQKENTLSEAEQNQQAEEERVETQEEDSSGQIVQHIDEIEDSGLPPNKNNKNKKNVSAALLHQYGGEDVGGRILHARQMTIAEYKKAKKEIKSMEEFWNSPLIYLMFRAEGQIEANFIEWTNKIEKEISK